ncbi:TPR repeat-containing protein [Candidatus Thiomargarita nelsonii]|uniref:TPR repeat-containing protein n=1 Tax=Candidatus Thiomargarita nelsonii TaxID=1003181 RepID=A0A176RUY5_9GAMM|nr:TPR repeat-containing protein [Candidatus Thiomargarita nelsonii]
MLAWVSPLLAVEAEEAFAQAKVYYDKKDFTQAAPWLEKAAVQGHADAQSLLGSMYLIGRGVSRDTAQAIHWLKKAADQGHAEAQSLLGAIYLVEKDFAQAYHWLQKSAEQGLADAQYLLGAMYYEGKGVAQNTARAYHFFSLAGAQGHKAAIAARDKLSPPPLDGKYRLTVNAKPVKSRIRIMNIKPKYRPGIALKR